MEGNALKGTEGDVVINFAPRPAGDDGQPAPFIVNLATPLDAMA